MLGKKLTIIGGTGGMGQVFTKYFKNHGFTITLYARTIDTLKQVSQKLKVSYDDSLQNSVKDADLVLISIPIGSTPDMIRKVAPYLKEDALLFDISSVKRPIFKAYQQVLQSYKINCVSLHPMFGPGIKDMNNYVMLVIRAGGSKVYDELIEDIENLFKSDGLIITETTPEVHDKRVSLTLGVPHMLNILFLTLLHKAGEPLNELTRYTGTTFLLQKVFAESIIQREMDMFGEIQMENHEFYAVLELFETLLLQYKQIIKTKNKSEFDTIFSQGLLYSQKDDHFALSYQYFYEFMKILKKENPK
jgi:prephenate dehydrogenase